jgi:hypothetical protein
MLRNLTRGRKKYIVLPLIAASIATGARAFDLGDVLKGGLIGVAVEALAPEINKAINTLLMNRKVENRQETKVVPILTVGKGAKVGAAQVIGEKADVDKVKAVAQLEGSASKLGFKALIPVESLDLTNLKRVYGVGLSALIDYKL